MPWCCGGKDDVQEPQSSSNRSNSEVIQVVRQTNIEYSITVKTGDDRNAGTDGPVFIKIFGRDDKQTDEILLKASSTNEKPFQSDCTKKFTIIAVDIGKPQRIIIRHEDKIHGWLVDYVEISVNKFLVRFVANRWLNESKNDRKLSVELFGSEQPAVLYKIQIETGDQQIEPLDSPVYVQVFGTTTTTPKLFLSSKTTSFAKNSADDFTISSNNVGEIQRIIIGHEALGTINDWHLKSVKLQMLAQQKQYTVDKWLSSTKDDKQLFVELTQETPPPPPPPPSTYSVSVQTGNVQNAGTMENIELIVRGTQGQIAKIPLKNHTTSNEKPLFQQGNMDQFQIIHADIGNIESITIGFSDSGQKFAWLLEHVNIKYQDTVYHFQARCWLSSRLGSDYSWMTIKPHPSDDDIHYKVTIETGQSGLDANVILCIFGDENTTANLALKTTKDGTEAKFDKDSTIEFDLEAIDVGKIKKINIGHDGKGDEQQWFLKSIKIEKKDEHYIFKADRWLSEEKDDHKTYIDLLPENEEKQLPAAPKKPQAHYAITIVTSSDKDAGTDSNVSMTIYGDKDNTGSFRLTETKQGNEPTFNSGQTTEFEMDLVEVGQITQINIGQDGKGLDPAWHLATVQIQKGSDIYKFVANKVLDDTTPYIDLTPAPKEVPPKAKPNEVTYKIHFQTDVSQQDFIADDVNLYVIIFGDNGETEKIPIKSGTESKKKIAFKKGEKTEFEVKTIDIGKVSKIILGQDSSQHTVVWHVDNVTVHRGAEKTTFNAERSLGQAGDDVEMELFPSPIPPKKSVKPPEPKPKEVNYKVLVRYGVQQDSTAIDNGELYMIIFGQNGQTKKMPLNTKGEFEHQTTDVGKILKIVIGQDSSTHNAVWHVDNVTIKRGTDTVTFNAERSIGQSGGDAEMELFPSPLPPKKTTTETPRKPPDTHSKHAVKTKDADYEIVTYTGETTFKAPVTVKIRGDTGTISIPLTKTKKDESPFQSNAIDEFTCRTTDVGKIKRITIEHTGTNEEEIWHLKKIKIKKGNDVYHFHTDVHLGFKENKANFYPVGALLGHKREDYVQTELRRLRESLRTESYKMHRPPHKAYEPFVYNDLSPYFDTTPVEKAIYAPLETPPGYYTRLTALRIVEPWEGYGMDYGVNYELLKQRKIRSSSSKRANVPSTDVSIDRTQGSTHLPKFPSVNMRKPAEYQRTLTMNDVPKIRTFVRTRYTAEADGQIEKDYKRTRDDIYRMQLDNVAGYHESNRDNMLRVYQSYLENTPGSKKALQELCAATGINANTA